MIDLLQLDDGDRFALLVEHRCHRAVDGHLAALVAQHHAALGDR